MSITKVGGGGFLKSNNILPLISNDLLNHQLDFFLIIFSPKLFILTPNSTNLIPNTNILPLIQINLKKIEILIKKTNNSKIKHYLGGILEESRPKSLTSESKSKIYETCIKNTCMG